MIVRSFDIVCDVCENNTLAQVLADNLEGAREIARDEGWGFSKRGDVCPDCKGRRTKEKVPHA